MLDDLVLDFLGTTTDDHSITSTENRDGILADVTEPDVGQCAGTKAVDTLKRISANDDVGDGCTVLEEENSVVAASVLVRVAWLATVKLLVAKVNITSDGAGLRERDDLAGASGDVESLRSRHAGDEREKCDLRNHDEGMEIFSMKAIPQNCVMN